MKASAGSCFGTYEGGKEGALISCSSMNSFTEDALGFIEMVDSGSF